MPDESDYQITLDKLRKVAEAVDALETINLDDLGRILGLKEGEIARIADVNHSTWYRWRTNSQRIDPKALARIYKHFKEKEESAG